MKTLWCWLVGAAISAATAFGGDLQPRGEHPRLFFTADRIAALKQRIAQEKTAADSWAAILATANQAIEKPGEAGRSIEALALAYRMTGDRRYAERVRDFLQREIKRSNWGEPDLLRRDPVWHAGLGLARSLFGAAVAYDSIYDALSTDERQTIAKAIVQLGVLPTMNDWVLGERRIHALDTMGHNWWSACVFTGGIGALAVLDEEPRAREWLQRIDAGSVEWFGYAGSTIENKPANFDRAGGFYESVNYASFAMAEYLLFRLAWTNALQSPPAEIPVLAKTGDFFIDVAYPNSGQMMTLNFGDGSIHADGSRPLSLLWANGIRNPDIAWYLRANTEMSYREGLDRKSPLGLIYFPSEADLASTPPLPPRRPSALYGDIGWAMLRSSWEKDATLLGIKSGYTWNHSHADEGSFILFHCGQYLLIDSGNPSYARPEYDNYYRQSPAHNVVLFNGQAENPEDTYGGSKFSGSVSHLIDTGDLKYIFADATGPTSRVFNRNYRHFVWIGDVILVIDDVEAFEPGQFEWLLHTAGKAERRGLDLTVSEGGASVVVRPLFPETFPDAGLPTDYPEKMRLIEKTGFKDHEPDTKVTYYAFAPGELTRRTKFITAITLVTDANKAHLPQIERMADKNALGVRIRQNGAVTDVYLNLRADGSLRHRNADATLGGYETDAYLFAATYADSDGGSGTPLPAGSDAAARNGVRRLPDLDAAARVLVIDGSYLRRDGKVVLDSLSKVFATWTARNGALDVVLQGQPVKNVRLREAMKPATLLVNGASAEASYDTTTQLLQISTADGRR